MIGPSAVALTLLGAIQWSCTITWTGPSPYVWSGTDQYNRGKYIADGHYDPHAIDKQLGMRHDAYSDETNRPLDEGEFT